MMTNPVTPCYVSGMRQKMKAEQSTEPPPPPWLHPDGFAWLVRVRPKTTVAALREEWVALLGAAYKMHRTHGAVAEVARVTPRVLRSWVAWLEKHAPEDAASLDRAASSERLPKLART